MIETPNLKHIKQKSKVKMIAYQFASFDLLTYFYSNFYFLCVKQLLSLIVFLKYAPLNSLWTILT